MERRVLRARVLGYRNEAIAAHLGLNYVQVKNARARIAAKARRLWDGHVPCDAETAREVLAKLLTTVNNSANLL